MSKKTEIRAGGLLYADPMLHDPYFGRTVILITSFDDQGTVGFIVNKKLEVTINDILPEPLGMDFDVFYGGPVGTDTLYFLHSLGDTVPDSVPLGNNLFWGGDFSVIARLIETGDVTPEQVKFFVGYAGWGSGQLEEELRSDSWLIGAENPEFIFYEDSCESAWKNKMDELGSKYSVWANFPQNPSMN